MTPRQQSILHAVVELYAQTAEPVGSLALAESFEASSATLRAEMVALERLGYIYQPHISAGRVPTDKGYRAYVNSKENTPADSRISRAIAKRVNSAGEVERSIKQAADSLAEVTGNVGLAFTGNGLYTTGLAGLFGQPEFLLGSQAYEVARLLDNLDEWLSEAAPEGRISVYIGTENPVGKASGASLIIARFASPLSSNSYVGVLGPTRQSYEKTIGLVDYTGRLLEEVLN